MTSRALTRPLQPSQQLLRCSGTVTSHSWSKSVMERWNSWSQVKKRLSAAFLPSPISSPDYSQLNWSSQGFHWWNKHDAMLRALLPSLHWQGEVFLSFNSTVLPDSHLKPQQCVHLTGRHSRQGSRWTHACPRARRPQGPRVKCQLFLAVSFHPAEESLAAPRGRMTGNLCITQTLWAHTSTDG